MKNHIKWNQRHIVNSPYPFLVCKNSLLHCLYELLQRRRRHTKPLRTSLHTKSVLVRPEKPDPVVFCPVSFETFKQPLPNQDQKVYLPNSHIYIDAKVITFCYLLHLIKQLHAVYESADHERVKACNFLIMFYLTKSCYNQSDIWQACTKQIKINLVK